MRYAFIEDKIVTNIIVAEQDFIDAHYPDAVECGDDVNIGHIYDKKKFTAPPPNIAVDETISK
jgi:hypothetical protein